MFTETIAKKYRITYWRIKQVSFILLLIFFFQVATTKLFVLVSTFILEDFHKGLVALVFCSLLRVGDKNVSWEVCVGEASPLDKWV